MINYKRVNTHIYMVIYKNQIDNIHHDQEIFQIIDIN